jgi:hypothetical protein
VPHFSLATGGFLAAPSDIIWDQLVDRESVSAWLEGIERLSGVGERFATRRATAPCSKPVEGRVLRMERPRRIGVVLRAPWRLLHEIELDIVLEPEDGGTRVDLHATYRLRWLGGLVRPWLRLRAQIALHRASRGLRAAIDDEMARRRRFRGGRSGAARPDAAQRAPHADQLLLRTIQG